MLLGLGWAGLGAAWGGLWGFVLGHRGWVALLSSETEIGVLETVKLCSDRKELGFRLANSNKQFLSMSFLRL